MIRAHGRRFCGAALVGRRVASRIVSREQPVVAVLSADRLAVEVVRHLNARDLDGFCAVVAPTVRLHAAETSTTLSAGELFIRLSTVAPRQTLCAARVRGDAATARVDLEVAWPVPTGDVAESSLGTLALECAAGRVMALTLDLDVDPAVARAAAALRAQPLRRSGAARLRRSTPGSASRSQHRPAHRLDASRVSAGGSSGPTSPIQHWS